MTKPYVTSLKKSATQHYQNKHWELALQDLIQILVHDPFDKACLWLAAATAYQLADAEQTQEFLQCLLALDPFHEQALLQLMRLLMQQQRWAECLPYLLNFYAHQPSHPELTLMFANVLFQQKDAQVLDVLKHYLIDSPKQWKAWNLLGSAYSQQKNVTEAQSSYLQASQLAPEQPEPLYNLGLLLYQENAYEEAYSVFHRVLKIVPQHVPSMFHLARSCQALCYFAEAESWYRRVLEYNQDDVLVWVGLGNVSEAQSCFDEAERCYHKALELDPQSEATCYSLSYLQLSRQNIPAGWDFFDMAYRPPLYLPNGERIPYYTEALDSTLKHLLVAEESGLGDVIQFIRFIPLLFARGYQISFYPQTRRWDRLLSTNYSNMPIIHSFSTEIHIDACLPLMQIMKFLGCTAEQFGTDGPYLQVAAASETHQLPDSYKPRIAIVWASGKKVHRPALFNAYKLRTASLAVFAPLVGQFPQAHFYSLQVGADADQLAAHPELPITDLAPQISDMYDTATYIMQMDLVITVDTAVAHLAGALGKPVWILLPKACDWRWGHVGETTPWYPSACLFRQTEFLQWQPVIQSVIDKLPKFFNSLSGTALV